MPQITLALLGLLCHTEGTDANQPEHNMTTAQAIAKLLAAHQKAEAIARRLNPQASAEEIHQIVSAELIRQLGL